MVEKFIDDNFRENTKSVIAIVTSGSDVYLVCRGEAAAAQVRNRLAEMEPQAVTTSESFRVIPDSVKHAFFLSMGSVVKLKNRNVGAVMLALTEWHDGSINHSLVSESLQDDVLKAASAKKR